MNTHRIINWLLGIAIALVISAMCNLDELGPDDRSAEMAQAQDMATIQRAEATQTRFAVAAAAVCGPNAAAQDLGDGTVQCMTHKGRKTTKVAL